VDLSAWLLDFFTMAWMDLAREMTRPLREESLSYIMWS
jgi:hypothetical protein